MELGPNHSCLHVVGTNHAYLQLRAEPRQVADVIECQQNFAIIKTDLHITYTKIIIILDYFTSTACRASDN
jgi:hypothetical protein